MENNTSIKGEKMTKVRKPHPPTRERLRKTEWPDEYDLRKIWAVTELLVLSTGEIEYEHDWHYPAPRGVLPEYHPVEITEKEAKRILAESPNTVVYSVKHRPGYTKMQRA